MLQSMTGYGRSEFTFGEYICSIEIRSLNGKQFELSTKLPPILKFYEIELRNTLQQHLTRGSVDVTIFLKQHGVSKPQVVNVELAEYYYHTMMKIAKQLNLETNDILPTLMRMPEIVSSVSDTVNETDWHLITNKINETCQILTSHRQKEGIMLTKHILSNIHKIKLLCSQVDLHEKGRLDKIRERLQNAVNELTHNGTVDRNRLEQEIIFYVEKLDINEEKNRLAHHCEYFEQLLNDAAITKGKKLGFLLQEIGREINTLGSKANDVAIQKLVVDMKDELEQAKEQLLNAL